MKFIKDNKLYIILILLSLVGVWFYMTYFSEPPASPTLTSDQTVSPLSQDVLVTLSNLTTITLDNSIFSDQLFTSLNDYGVAIPPQAAGRRNPFAPL